VSCCIEQTNGIAGGGGAAVVDNFDHDNALELVPANTGAAPLNLGIPNVTSGGGSHPPLAAASLLESTPRWRATSAVGAGSSSQHRSNIGLWLRGAVAGVGGFHYRARFGVSVFVAGFRAFVGLLAQTAAIAGVDPSTLVDQFGMAYNLGQTQWSIFHNDNAGASTQVPLGAGFNVVANDFLQLDIIAAAAAADIDYLVTNLTTGAVASGTIAAELPVNTTFLCSHAWVNTGNVAATAAQVDIARIAVAPPI
jgi:hypothetical protein